MASLTYIYNEQARTVELEQPRMVVGRVPGCDIYINNRSVSRQHCVFLQKNGAIFVQDLGSANGTYVQGKKITECALNNDDVVMLGDFKMWFKSGNGTGKAESSAPDSSEAVAAPAAAEKAPAVAQPAAVPVQPAAAMVAEEPKPKEKPVEKAPESVADARISVDSQDFWFYAIKDQRLGPVDSPSLRRLAKDRIVSDDTLVWKEGMPDWLPARQVKGLYDPQAPAAKPEVPSRASAKPVQIKAVEPEPKEPSAAVSPFATLPVSSPAAVPASVAGGFDVLQKKIISEVAKYSIIWGVLLLLSSLWQAYMITKSFALMRVDPSGFNKSLFFGLILLTMVTVLCGVLSVRIAGAFRKAAREEGESIGNLMDALTSLERLYSAQCFWGLLVLLATVVLTSLLPWMQS